MSVEEQREELARVLHSSEFRRAPKLQKFLELVCEYHFSDRAAELSEFVIATEAFGKGPGFDPSRDSIVRVQAREARRRLREYYGQEGKGDPLVLDIPIGAYVPVFLSAGTPVAPQHAPPRLPLWPKIAAVALFTIAILLAASLGRRYLVRTVGSPGAVRTLTPALASLWNRFINSDAPTILVLSNPTVSGCAPDGPPDEAPPGACPDEYTGMGEAVALYLVTNVFHSAEDKLTVKQSRTLTEDDVRRSNLVLLGGRMVNPWTRRLAPDVSLTDSAEQIPGQVYETTFDSAGKLTRDRAVMAMRRNAATGRWLLVLYGAHSQGTHAVAEAATDERFLSRLKWPASTAPFPDRFQVLVSVKVGEGASQEAVPVAVRVP